MFVNKTGKSILVKRSLVFFIVCLAFSFLTGGHAFAEHYLEHGVRESLSNQDKIALVREESRNLCWCEVENRVKDMEKASDYSNSGIKGRVRAHLSTCEKAGLMMEEDESLMEHDMPVIQSRIREEVSQGRVDMGKSYVYGSFRENLSGAEKRRLAHEE